MSWVSFDMGYMWSKLRLGMFDAWNLTTNGIATMAVVGTASPGASKVALQRIEGYRSINACHFGISGTLPLTVHTCEEALKNHISLLLVSYHFE